MKRYILIILSIYQINYAYPTALSRTISQKCMQACKQGNVEKLTTLFSECQKAKQDMQLLLNPSGKKTLLHQAVLSQSPDRYRIIELLLQHGALIDAVDDDEQTALMYAVKKDKLKMVLFLLQHGASPNLYGKHTPPILAAFSDEHMGIVEVLLNYGADAGLAQDHETPLLHRLIIDKQFNGPENLTERVITSPHTSLNRLDTEGRSALHYAIQVGNLYAATLLVNHGINIHLTNKAGRTALFYALLKCKLDLAHLLINKDAQLTAQEKKDLFASIAKIKNKKKILDFFKQHHPQNAPYAPSSPPLANESSSCTRENYIILD